MYIAFPDDVAFSYQFDRILWADLDISVMLPVKLVALV